jgi:cytoskeleton protein RodZ
LLEAIENEEWDLLPAPTLVKGFIRSYARVLGLDEERILDLYREETGADHFTQEFVLPSIPQRKKWPSHSGRLADPLAAVSAFYVWFLPPIEPDGNGPKQML